MKFREIDFTEHMPETIAMMRTDGLLLTSVGADGRPNVMTIGWGSPGVIWGRPIFIAYVRPSRFTFKNIEATREFAVAVPDAAMHDVCMTCGTLSGRDVDKFAESDLTVAPAQTVRAPLIAECVRFYECKVVHVNDLVDGALDPEIRSGAYPKGDFHRLYYGQILKAAERK